ncbi:MAG: DsbA family protein [Anaerolineaceae bacterium]|nr:DsbA family protein [Anaerolineaceae bacterium]
MDQQEQQTPVPAQSEAQMQTPLADEAAPIAVIPKTVFNYFVIAVVFFMLGAAVTALGYNGLFDSNTAENTGLINQAVGRAVNEALDARDATAVASVRQSDNTAAAVGDTNADVINEAVNRAVNDALDARDATAAAIAQAQNGPVQGEFYTVSADDDPYVGAVDAPVEIVEFSDFNCTYCNRFYNETLSQVLETYGDQVRFVYRDFPILAQSSVTAALAAQCAFEQGDFWDYHNVLFDNRGNFSREQLIGYAETLGLNIDQFTNCLDNQQYQAEIVADFQDAQALGIRGTPAFFVNGRFISGAQPFAVFASAIDAELAKLQGLDTPG